MKRLALLFSIFSLVFAFSVSTASAQKATGDSKPAVEKSCAKEKAACAETKAACAEKKSACAESKACCSKKAETSSCAKKCGDAKKAECTKQKETGTDEVPVPKKN